MKIKKTVSDLGVAAYMLMHGYTVTAKRNREIEFELDDQEQCEEFDKLLLEYQPPNEYYTFDSCLMFLKKIDISVSEQIEKDALQVVTDLGVAAYMLMQEYKPNSLGLRVVGKKGKCVYFYCNPDKVDQFQQLSLAYLTSPYQTYDSGLMGLKKLPTSK